MPSLRSKLINLVMRHTARKHVEAAALNVANIVAIRSRLDGFGAGTAPLPGQRRETIALGGVPTEVTRVIAPRGTVYYCHGGGYMVGSPQAYRRFANRLAKATDYDVAMIDYRLAPEHPFPAAPDDALNGYRALLDAGNDPREIVIAGDSAGGNLALVTLLRIKENGLPLPRSAVLLSPWTDLTGSGDSVLTNADADPMLPASRIMEGAAIYARDHALDDPHISPCSVI
ncbi:MAG: alpha/beta hydrolase [Gammaproteobacteria bacterium]|nr:alpha/beta hydrolase [Gammaproteobacteria bacterium]